MNKNLKIWAVMYTLYIILLLLLLIGMFALPLLSILFRWSFLILLLLLYIPKVTMRLYLINKYSNTENAVPIDNQKKKKDLKYLIIKYLILFSVFLGSLVMFVFRDRFSIDILIVILITLIFIIVVTQYIREMIRIFRIVKKTGDKNE